MLGVKDEIAVLQLGHEGDERYRRGWASAGAKSRRCARAVPRPRAPAAPSTTGQSPLDGPASHERRPCRASGRTSTRRRTCTSRRSPRKPTTPMAMIAAYIRSKRMLSSAVMIRWPSPLREFCISEATTTMNASASPMRSPASTCGSAEGRITLKNTCNRGRAHVARAPDLQPVHRLGAVERIDEGRIEHRRGDDGDLGGVAGAEPGDEHRQHHDLRDRIGQRDDRLIEALDRTRDPGKQSHADTAGAAERISAERAKERVARVPPKLARQQHVPSRGRDHRGRDQIARQTCRSGRRAPTPPEPCERQRPAERDPCRSRVLRRRSRRHAISPRALNTSARSESHTRFR